MRLKQYHKGPHWIGLSSKEDQHVSRFFRFMYMHQTITSTIKVLQLYAQEAILKHQAYTDNYVDQHEKQSCKISQVYQVNITKFMIQLYQAYKQNLVIKDKF